MKYALRFNFNKESKNLTAQTTQMLLKYLLEITLITFSATQVLYAQNWHTGSESYQYNSGPDLSTPYGQDFIRLYAEQPENKYLSDNLTPKQKFRFTFGAMMLRTNFHPNTVKIFAIGQDAVDDAELVKLPGTGTGYSTRVQAMANFHGVDQSLATSNASFQTIRAQYGAFDHPIVELDSSNKPTLNFVKLVDNNLWNLFNGEHSAIRKHREEVWETQILNNLNSMRLIILFGGAAHDAFAEFLIHRGFRVSPKINPERLKRLQVPETKMVFAGGNDEFPVLQTKNGGDLYAKLLEKSVNYESDTDKELANQTLVNQAEEAIKLMAFTGGGISNSGLIHPAQIDGYNLNSVEKFENGKWVKTKSLKGLKLKNGITINTDIAFVASPHPTSLSKNLSEASVRVKAIFDTVQHLIGGDKVIEPDLDENGKPRVNHYVNGDDFDYGRAYLPKQVVPFGAPASILRPRYSADRLGPQVLVAEPPSYESMSKEGYYRLSDIFDYDKIEAAKNATPIEPLNPYDLWNQRSRQPHTQAQYDLGPGADYAKLMTDNLDSSTIALSSAKSLGYFAHYRGSFSKANILVLHDPIDLEDRNTFRAATGLRGQYLQGLIQTLGEPIHHLILKTVPLEMNGKADDVWTDALVKTETYREKVITQVLQNNSVKIIFTDGIYAHKAIQKLKDIIPDTIPIVNIPRTQSYKNDMGSAATDALATGKFQNINLVTNAPAAIPREHLPWNSREWERVTSGTVIDAKPPFSGKSYLIVTPNFVAKQNIQPLPSSIKSVEDSLASLEQFGVKPPKESIRDFLKRTNRSGDFNPAAINSKP